MFNTDEIYTVSDFLSLCNKVIHINIPSCWIQGELSNLKLPASGHWYFLLKDNESSVRCALFRLNQKNINFIPENGTQVLVKAATTLYEVRGDFQIIIERLEAIGIGNLQLAFEQLKNKLKNEGLFDKLNKKPLPKQVNTIGVITSSSGAVIKDIIKVLNKRYPFAKIFLFDSIVQGKNAADKLVAALNSADKKNCDVLIIGRGGGSLEDLWEFNREVLVRAVFNAKTPIVSAIGHETDVTIVDFVSDVSVPTPSAAAVIVSPDKLQLKNATNKFYNQLCYLSIQIVKNYQNSLKQLDLKNLAPIKQINMLSQRLDDIDSHLKYHAKVTINLHNAKLNKVHAQLKQYSPLNRIKHEKAINTLLKQQIINKIAQTIDKQKKILFNLKQQLIQYIQAILKLQKAQLLHQIKNLNHLSPLNIFTRGYSITNSANGKILYTIKKAVIGEIINTKLIDGIILSKIYNIKKN